LAQHRGFRLSEPTSGKEIVMRFTVSSSLLVLSVAGLASIATPAAAAGQNKYCLQGGGWDRPGNCTFSSLAQCRAAASGTRASCGINPRYSFARQRGHSGGQGQRY